MRLLKKYGLSKDIVNNRFTRLKKDAKPEIIDRCFRKKIDHSMIIEGKNFPSINKAAKAYNISSSGARFQLKKLPDNATQKDKNLCFTVKPIVNNSKFVNPIMVEGECFSTILKAARHYGISENTIRYRLNKLGDNPTQEKVDQFFKANSFYGEGLSVKGKLFSSVLKAADEYKLTYSTVITRLSKLNKNPSPEEIDGCFQQKTV